MFTPEGVLLLGFGGSGAGGLFGELGIAVGPSGRHPRRRPRRRTCEGMDGDALAEAAALRARSSAQVGWPGAASRVPGRRPRRRAGRSRDRRVATSIGCSVAICLKARSSCSLSRSALAVRGVICASASPLAAAASTPSSVPWRTSSAAAVFAPIPGAPGSPSDGSPRSAMKSLTCAGRRRSARVRPPGRSRRHRLPCAAGRPTRARSRPRTGRGRRSAAAPRPPARCSTWA